MTLQAVHCEVQTSLQQKLSTHRPFWQSPSTLHDDPTGTAVVHWCVPELQFGAAAVQSALLAQLVRQAFPLQLRLPGQGTDADAVQVPEPLQNGAAVSVLPLQV